MGNTIDAEKAIEEIDHALKLRPHSSKVLEAAGTVYASLGQPDKANDYYQRALKVNPGAAGLLCSIAEFYLNQKKYDSSAHFAKECITINPKVTWFGSWREFRQEPYKILNESLTHLQRTDEYLDFLINMTKKYGEDNPEILEFLAKEQCLAGLFEDAEKTYNRRLSLKEDLDAMLGLGMVQWLSGNPESAFITFESVLNNRVGGVYWRYELRVISLLKYLKKFDEIELRLDIVQQADIWIWDYFAIRYYGSMRRFDEALAVRTEALKKIERGLTVSWQLLIQANLYLQKGDFANCLEILNKSDELSSNAFMAEANLDRAHLSAIEGDLKQALYYIKKTMEDSPAENLLNSSFDYYATIQFANGQHKEALNTLKNKNTGNSISAMYLRARLEMMTDSVQAENSMKKTQLFAARESRQVSTWYDLGRARSYCALTAAQLGDSIKAIEEIQYAQRLEPERADIAYCSACTYSLLGDKTLALQWLNTTVERGYKELWWAKVDPDLDPLRDLPRFKEIMKDWDDRIQAMLAKSN
jgi:tetratricopeptide (TPR) repeat protein